MGPCSRPSQGCLPEEHLHAGLRRAGRGRSWRCVSCCRPGLGQGSGCRCQDQGSGCRGWDRGQGARAGTGVRVPDQGSGCQGWTRVRVPWLGQGSGCRGWTRGQGAGAGTGVRVLGLGQGSGCQCWDRSRRALRWDAAPPLWPWPPGWSPQKAQHSHQAFLGLYDCTPGLWSPSARLGPPSSHSPWGKSAAAEGTASDPVLGRGRLLAP